jgi:hypothetical protein
MSAEEITYRIAQSGDLQGLTDATSAAFWDDQISAALSPNRESDPYHYRDGWYTRGRLQLFQRDMVIYVAEAYMPVNGSNERKKKIVGFAKWTKSGRDSVETQKYWMRGLSPPLIQNRDLEISENGNAYDTSQMA